MNKQSKDYYWNVLDTDQSVVPESTNKAKKRPFRKWHVQRKRKWRRRNSQHRIHVVTWLRRITDVIFEVWKRWRWRVVSASAPTIWVWTAICNHGLDQGRGTHKPDYNVMFISNDVEFLIGFYWVFLGYTKYERLTNVEPAPGKKALQN